MVNLPTTPSRHAPSRRRFGQGVVAVPLQTRTGDAPSPYSEAKSRQMLENATRPNCQGSLGLFCRRNAEALPKRTADVPKRPKGGTWSMTTGRVAFAGSGGSIPTRGSATSPVGCACVWRALNIIALTARTPFLCVSSRKGSRLRCGKGIELSPLRCLAGRVKKKHGRLEGAKLSASKLPVCDVHVPLSLAWLVLSGLETLAWPGDVPGWTLALSQSDTQHHHMLGPIR